MDVVSGLPSISGAINSRTGTTLSITATSRRPVGKQDSSVRPSNQLCLSSSLLGTRLKVSSGSATALLAQQRHASKSQRRQGRRPQQIVSIFEKFTEGAIKAVMMAQAFAVRMQAREVNAAFLVHSIITSSYK